MTKVTIEVEKSELYEIQVFNDSSHHIWQEWDHTSKIAIIVESRSTSFDWADELPFHDDESYTEWLNSDIFIRKYPLFIYDHSGIAFSISDNVYPFNTGWDTAHVGWIYILKEGNEGLTREEATKVILGEVEDLNTYHREGFLGFGVVNKLTKEVLYSIGGFLGEDEVRRGIKQYLEPEYQNLPLRYV